MELQEKLNQVSETIEKLQAEKEELERELQVIEDETREERIHQFNKDVNEYVETVDGLTYNHRTIEFVYHSNEGHNLYYSYDVDNKQSLDIVKQDIERNIRLHHLLKDFDYRFYDYIGIGPEQPNAYTKINFSSQNCTISMLGFIGLLCSTRQHNQNQSLNNNGRYLHQNRRCT